MNKNIVFYLAAGFLALAMKYHYSTAEAHNLAWILAATSALVNLATNAGFDYRVGEGFISADGAFVIAPACAGINFLIICFTMLVFTQLRHVRGWVKKFCLVFGSAVFSFGLTLVVNTCRISLSMHSFRSSNPNALLMPENMHRLEGIAIYFLALSLVYLLSGYCFDGGLGQRFESEKPSLAAPLFWYFLVTIVIPILRMSFLENPGRFIEHSFFALGIPLTIAAAFAVVVRIVKAFALAITDG